MPRVVTCASCAWPTRYNVLANMQPVAMQPRHGESYTTAELQRLRGAFAAQESAVNKCSLLGGWHDRKKEILEEGFKRQHQLVEVKNWHDNEAAKLSEFHIDRKSAIENAKIFYDQSETEVQKAYASAAENARAALAVNQSEYALFLSQNERKLFSLRELASAKCRLGSGVCYEPEANCNLLL